MASLSAFYVKLLATTIMMSFSISLVSAEAFRGTNLVVTVTLLNDEIPIIAATQSAANDWVQSHIVPFVSPQNGAIRFRYIAVGNEAIPGSTASLVAPAMRNIHQALISSGVPSDVKVTTVVSPTVLGQSFPPSAGVFENSVSDCMRDVINFLNTIGSPLLINAYPYFALASDPAHISMDYALFQAQNPIIDGPYKYFNLFDAMVDAFVAAVEKVVGYQNGVKVVVSETGWPTKGNEPYTCVDNARTYNRNLKDHVQNVGGTPRMQNYMEVYIYSMFNEDIKPDLVGQSFGAFNKDFTEIYPIWH
ncbi:putative glucan endo-1,3-beta-glucosidase GVI [Senna tora]|uniref:glucan endo-1,3-beta-D-glucosidase n=1 Tax=Senna tora TaxID=362788 RepID=A0A835CE49_9FABA|nr:putative glucan endo-1,3-beta-glucosidase GVI [Senna tora]